MEPERHTLRPRNLLLAALVVAIIGAIVGSAWRRDTAGLIAISCWFAAGVMVLTAAVTALVKRGQ